MADPAEGMAPEVDTGIAAPEVPPEGSAGNVTEGQAAAEGAAAAPQEPETPEPQYVTREILDQSVSGLSQEMRRQVEQMQQILAASQRAPAAQPKTEDEFPDYQRFEQEVLSNPQQFYSMIKDLREGQTKTARALEEKIIAMRQELQTRDQTERYYQYVTNQTQAVVKQHPVLADEQVQEVLKGQIAAHISANNGDLQKVDIPKIAKDMALLIERLKGEPAKQAPAPAVKAPPRGSPSIPGAPKPREINTIDDFDAGIDDLLAAAAEAEGRG